MVGKVSVSYSRNPLVDRSLRHSVRDGIAYAVMSGAGETYFSAFALFLKATAPQVAVLATLPPLLAPGGSLTGAQNQLFVRTTPDNLAELKAVLAETS